MKELIRQSTKEEADHIAKKLIEFNLTKAPFHQNPPWDKLSYIALNEVSDIIGGINASLVWASSLSIHQLWVDDKFRDHGIGRKLLLTAENEARRQGAQMAHLDTLEFQALAFYQKQGYEIFGTLEGSPCKGHKRYYMKKAL